MTGHFLDSDSVIPEPLARFEQDLLRASDPESLLEAYRTQYPEWSELLGKLADAVALLQATEVRPATQAAASAPLPARFGPYTIVRSIGHGGMGEVYEALEEPLGRRVAVKTVRRDDISPSLLARFDRERRTLARLHHTNVVPIYATGTEGDLLYFAMPYLSGASLGQVIKTARSYELAGNGLASSSFEKLLHEAHSKSQSASEPPRGPEATVMAEPPSAPPSPPAVSSHHLSLAYIRSAVGVMATVAEGLHHAHEAGVVHRDLKPANIIVESNGHAWVLDFGLAAIRATDGESPLAHAAEPAAPGGDPTLTAGPLGTPCYMAPEQHADSRQADARCDVWSMGATLYELLTLQRAFANRQDVLESDTVPPRRLTPELDRALEAVVLKAIAKNPAQRYATAQALSDDLKHWLRGEPVSAWPTHRLARPPWRLWLWSKRNKGWAAAVALAVLGSLSLGVFAEERRENAAELARAQERRVEMLEVQEILQGRHLQNWSYDSLNRIKRLAWKPAERGEVQGLAVASLTGLDAKFEKTLPIYAPALAYAPDGRLWMGNTGQGVKRWNPETERIDTWPLEVDGPLAIRSDGSVCQLGPTYSRPDTPGRSPLDPRPDPSFPLQLLEIERQAVDVRLADPIEEGSRLLAWTLAAAGTHAAAIVSDSKHSQHVILWDMKTGHLFQRYPCPSSPVSPALPGPGLAFSPDASLLVTWDGSGRLDLWNVSEGRAAGTLAGRSPVQCVAFGPNRWLREAPRSMAGRWLLAVGDADGQNTLWSLDPCVVWRTLRSPGLGVFSLAFSPDGTQLASAGRYLSGGKIWDVATGRLVLELSSGDYVTALAYSPDGSRLATSRRSLFSPPGERDFTQVFRLERDRGIQSLRGLPGSPVKACFSRDGQRVAALSWDWWAGVWDRDSGRLLRMISVPRGQYADNADLAFSPDGASLAVSAGNTASLWNIATGESRLWRLPWALTEAIAFVDDDRLILVRTELEDGSRPPGSETPASDFPRLCPVRNLLGANPITPISTIKDFPWGVQEIVATPDGSCFIIVGRGAPPHPGVNWREKLFGPDGTFLTELPTSIPSNISPGHQGFDAGGKLFFQYVLDGPRPYFEVPSGRFLGSAPARVIAAAPGGRYWSSIGVKSGQLLLLDESGKVLIDRLTNTEGHTAHAFSPDLDGRYLLWGTREGTVAVMDIVESGRRLTDLGLGW